MVWTSATDPARVAREGQWAETSFRYADRGHLWTEANSAALVFGFAGRGLAVRLGQHAVPAFGQPNLGDLAVWIDGRPARAIHPAAEPREISLASDLPPGPHTVRIEHHVSPRGAGARVEAFGCSNEPTGAIAFSLLGEHNAYLVDARAVVRREGEVVANRLVRNWLTGGCRLAGLPPGKGYRLELEAIGWEPASVEGVEVAAGRDSVLPPLRLRAEPRQARKAWLFPHLGRQAVRRPGESFRARFQADDDDILGARIERRVGPATISRRLGLQEDKAAAFYYDREVEAALPRDTPQGLYDLIVQTRAASGGEREFRSHRAVMVVGAYPTDPVFASWGHLDTQGQYQAEYLSRLVETANLAGADMALMANECNPAYVAGALRSLEIPCAVNFGNHQFPGFEQWFGPQESAIDYGPNLRVLNRSLPWCESTAQADALLAARPEARIKVINAFEHNAPLDLLDRHRVALVHDGHGPGGRVMEMGATPTLRVGKTNSESFRMIRFAGGRVVSCAYMGAETDPIPFPRGATPPLRAVVTPEANGANREVEARIVNDLGEAFPRCRVTLLMPAGSYVCDGGRIESAASSDCGRYVALTVRADAPAGGATVVKVKGTAR